MQPPSEIGRDAGPAIVAQQSQPMSKVGAGQSGYLERHLQRVGDVARSHRRTELPGQNVAREVAEHGGQTKPALPMTFR
jgi:hypothetical protein